MQGGLLVAVDAARQAHPDKRITLWFQDEARVGQKGRVCYRWWTRGQRPPGLCDQRYTWVHLFAGVRPATGERFALVMPAVSTEVMNIFLEGFSGRLLDDEHAVMVLDQAGWHRANELRVPHNMSLVPLPPYSPELNSVERLWLYLRERHLSAVCSTPTNKCERQPLAADIVRALGVVGCYAVAFQGSRASILLMG
jgi:transposase